MRDERKNEQRTDEVRTIHLSPAREQSASPLDVKNLLRNCLTSSTARSWPLSSNKFERIPVSKNGNPNAAAEQHRDNDEPHIRRCSLKMSSVAPVTTKTREAKLQ